MIKIDRLRSSPYRGSTILSSHLYDDSSPDGKATNSLKEFAQSIGLKPSYLHRRPGFEHFDVFGNVRHVKALAQGAVLVSDKELIDDKRVFQERINNLKISWRFAKFLRLLQLTGAISQQSSGSATAVYVLFVLEEVTLILY